VASGLGIEKDDDVKRYLYNYIKKMDTKKGTKLPSEAVIAKRLSVSRVTIRCAFDDLEKKGLIFRIHGKGTFINPEAINMKVNLNVGQEFKKLIQECGYESSFDIQRFDKLKADQKLADILKIDEGDYFYHIEKLYYADGHPAIVSIDRIPCAIFHQELSLETCQELSVFEILRQNAGRIITRDKIEIETMSVKSMRKISRCADAMACDSVLIFHGINYDQDNNPVIYDTEFYNTKYIHFSILRTKSVF